MFLVSVAILDRFDRSVVRSAPFPCVLLRCVLVAQSRDPLSSGCGMTSGSTQSSAPSVKRSSSGPMLTCHRAGSHSSTRSITPTTVTSLSNAAYCRIRGREHDPSLTVDFEVLGMRRPQTARLRSLLPAGGPGLHLFHLSLELVGRPQGQTAVPELGEIPAVLERGTKPRRQDHPTLAVERVLVRPEKPCHRIELPRRSPRMIGGLLPFTPLCATLAPTPPQVNANRLHLAPLAPLIPEAPPIPKRPPPPTSRHPPDGPGHSDARWPSRSGAWGPWTWRRPSRRACHGRCTIRRVAITSTRHRSPSLRRAIGRHHSTR